MGVHVDDVISTGTAENLEWLQEQLKKQYELKTQMIGEWHDHSGVYLGREIRWTSEGFEWRPNVEQIHKIIEAYGLQDGNSTNMPLTNTMLNMEFGNPMSPEDASVFRSMAARANYVAQYRPDLSLATAVAASQMGTPHEGAEMLLKKLARYLIGREVAVTRFPWQYLDEPALIVYTDSDWATEVRSRKSKTGGALYHGEHLVGHWARTQDRVARSSGEAELKAACTGIAELMGLAHLVRFLRPGVVRLEHRMDAAATIGMTQRQGAGALKHLSVRELWVQEVVQNESIVVTKVSRSQNPADALASVGRSADDFQRQMHMLNLTHEAARAA